jgi:hypothetical protein
MNWFPRDFVAAESGNLIAVVLNGSFGVLLSPFRNSQFLKSAVMITSPHRRQHRQAKQRFPAESPEIPGLCR